MRTPEQFYEPGRTNINQREARTMKESAYLATLSILIGFCLLLIFEVSIWLFGLLAPLVWLASMYYLQSSTLFCIRFGLRGLQNASRANISPAPVMSGLARGEDRHQARLLLLSSIIITLVVIAAIISLASIIL